MQFKQPPILHNKQGEIRKCGFELEFANIGIEDSVQIILKLYGGKAEKRHRFHQEVVGTRVGDFSVKIDLKLLNERSYKKPLDKLNINLQEYQLGESSLEFEVESALEDIVKKVIPYEIVTPPLPITEIEEFEKLRKSLYQNKAEGTKAAITNAFATHINIETPDTGAGTILHYLKSFLLLYPWIFRKSEIDLARRVTSFINPFPVSYIEKVLAPDYQPDFETLIEDYHIYNPDRNRPLDMYPMFAALRNEKVKQYSGLGNVKARETFHYRLPNSLISDPNWSLAHEWNHWIEVEELANKPKEVEQLCREYLELRQRTFIGFENKWTKHIDQWHS